MKTTKEIFTIVNDFGYIHINNDLNVLVKDGEAIFIDAPKPEWAEWVSTDDGTVKIIHKSKTIRVCNTGDGEWSALDFFNFKK